MPGPYPVAEQAAERHQLAVAARLDQLPALQHEDLVGVADVGEPVGDVDADERLVPLSADSRRPGR
jgi:hypothetical protein